MRVLVLSPYPERIAPTIEMAGDKVLVSEEKLTEPPDADFIISYGYRHIIREPIVSTFAGRAVNIHISLLPWNRGADPNFWSWLQDTPKGVTIHYIDAGIDTGPIALAQGTMFVGHERQTLRTTQDQLMRDADNLFKHAWPGLRHGYFGYAPQPQKKGTGNVHKSKDKDWLFSQLEGGYDSPVSEVRKLARDYARYYFYP